MYPSTYRILYKGKWTTVRTCGGPVGAFHGYTMERPKEWIYLNDRKTMVNNCLVVKING